MEMAAEEIVEKENFRITAVFDRIGSLEDAHIQTPTNKINWQENRGYQEESLQAICDNDGFQTSFEGIRPYQYQAYKHSNGKGYMIAVENEFLQNDNH